MLTECCPASLTNSEDPVRDLGNDLSEETPSQDWPGHQSVYKTIISRERHSGGFESPPHREHCSESICKHDVALLVTHLDMRVVSLLEAQELSETQGNVLHTLTISSQTKELSEVQLRHRPLLVLFKEGKTVKEAYQLLYSLLESFKLKSSHAPGQQISLVEALRRGIETGASMLTFHEDKIGIIPEIQQSSVSSTLESTGSVTSVHAQRRIEDVRRSAYKRMDSLEETIRELENTLIEISGHATTEKLSTETVIKSTPAQMTASPTSKMKKPPPPPKPSSLNPASIQVHSLHLLCPFLLWSIMLFFFSNLCFSSLDE